MKAFIDYQFQDHEPKDDINFDGKEGSFEIDIELAKMINIGDIIYFEVDEEEIECSVRYKWFNLIANEIRIDCE